MRPARETETRRTAKSIATPSNATISRMSTLLLGLPRVDETEWLDQGRGSDADVDANLDEMWRINQRLGGLSALTRHLYPRLRATQAPCSVIDLGTGSAQVQ